MAKKVIIDTDILSYYLKGIIDIVEELDRYEKENGPVYISRITIIEILGGLKAKDAYSQEKKFRAFIQTRNILEITEKIGEFASDIYATLIKSGRHSGSYDLLIAASAIENEMKLCSNNSKDYENIPGIDLINWKKN